MNNNDIFNSILFIEPPRENSGNKKLPYYYYITGIAQGFFWIVMHFISKEGFSLNCFANTATTKSW